MLLLFHPRRQQPVCWLQFLFISVNYPRDKRDESRRLTDWLKCDTGFVVIAVLAVRFSIESWARKSRPGFSFIVIKWVFSNFLTLNDLVHRSMLTDRSNPSHLDFTTLQVEAKAKQKQELDYSDFESCERVLSFSS